MIPDDIRKKAPQSYDSCFGLCRHRKTNIIEVGFEVTMGRRWPREHQFISKASIFELQFVCRTRMIYLFQRPLERNTKEPSTEDTPNESSMNYIFDGVVDWNHPRAWVQDMRAICQWCELDAKHPQNILWWQIVSLCVFRDRDNGRATFCQTDKTLYIVYAMRSTEYSAPWARSRHRCVFSLIKRWISLFFLCSLFIWFWFGHTSLGIQYAHTHTCSQVHSPADIACPLHPRGSICIQFMRLH